MNEITEGNALPKMNPTIKAIWLAELRSTTVPQAKGYLNCKDGMCCLGVLCDLAARQGLGSWNTDTIYDEESGESALLEYSYFGADEGDYEVPPEEIGTWAGFTPFETTNPVVKITPETKERYSIRSVNIDKSDGSYSTDLASLNDAGMPFSEIADLIEAQL